MSDPLVSRVTKLEVRVDGHDKELSKLSEDSDELKLSLFAIRNNLTQIKWAVIGAGAVASLQVLGLKDFIQLVFSFI